MSEKVPKPSTGTVPSAAGKRPYSTDGTSHPNLLRTWEGVCIDCDHPTSDHGGTERGYGCYRCRPGALTRLWWLLGAPLRLNRRHHPKLVASRCRRFSDFTEDLREPPVPL